MKINTKEEFETYLPAFRNMMLEFKGMLSAQKEREKTWWTVTSNIELDLQMLEGINRCEEVMPLRFSKDHLGIFYAYYCLTEMCPECLGTDKAYKIFVEIMKMAEAWQADLEALSLKPRTESNAIVDELDFCAARIKPFFNKIFPDQHTDRFFLTHECALDMLYDCCHFRAKLQLRESLPTQIFEFLKNQKALCPQAWQKALMMEHGWHMEHLQRQAVEKYRDVSEKTEFLDYMQTVFLVQEGLRFFEKHSGFRAGAYFTFAEALACDLSMLGSILIVDQLLRNLKVPPSTTVLSQIYKEIYRVLSGILSGNCDTDFDSLYDLMPYVVGNSILSNCLYHYGLKPRALYECVMYFIHLSTTVHFCRSIMRDVVTSPTRGRIRVQVITDSVGAGFLVPHAQRDVRAVLQLRAKFKKTCTISSQAIIGYKIEDAAKCTAKNNPANPLKVKRDIVVIPLGGNDVFADRPIEDIKKDAKQLIQNCAEAGVQYLLWIVGVPPTFITTHHKNPKYLKAYVEGLEDIAKEYEKYHHDRNCMKVVMAHIPEAFFSMLADKEAGIIEPIALKHKQEILALDEKHAKEKTAFSVARQEKQDLSKRQAAEKKAVLFMLPDGLHFGPNAQRFFAEFITTHLATAVDKVAESRLCHSVDTSTAVTPVTPGTLAQFYLHTERSKSPVERKWRDEENHIGMQTRPLPLSHAPTFSALRPSGV